MNEILTTWIPKEVKPTNGDNYNVPYTVYYCPNCNLRVHNDTYGKYRNGIYKYCPKCATYMLKEK